MIVSFGTQVDTSLMPKKLVEIFLKVFSKFLDYQIFWRIGPKLKLPGFKNLFQNNNSKISPNVNITTFIPQNELLGSFLYYN